MMKAILKALAALFDKAALIAEAPFRMLSWLVPGKPAEPVAPYIQPEKVARHELVASAVRECALELLEGRKMKDRGLKRETVCWVRTLSVPELETVVAASNMAVNMHLYSKRRLPGVRWARFAALPPQAPSKAREMDGYRPEPDTLPALAA